MKKITFLLFLGITFLSFSQQIVVPATDWKSKINAIFQGLDKTRVPNGILLDISQLKSGIYILKAIVYNDVLTKKVIK